MIVVFKNTNTFIEEYQRTNKKEEINDKYLCAFQRKVTPV